MKKFAFSALFATMALVAVPAFAETEQHNSVHSPTDIETETHAPKSVKPQCVQAAATSREAEQKRAVETRDAAIKAAADARLAARQAAIDARKSAITAAKALTDKDAQKTAMKKAESDFMIASKKAQSDFQTVQKTAQSTFKTAKQIADQKAGTTRKACKS